MMKKHTLGIKIERLNLILKTPNKLRRNQIKYKFQADSTLMKIIKQVN